MAIDPVTGGIISAGITGLGSLFGAKKDAERAAHAAVVASDRSDLQAREANAFTQGMAREANQFTQAERREQNEWNAEQIRLMNDYNNPANQRKLAEEAGFNPLIFAGAGTALQGAAASGGSGQGATGGAAQAQSYQAQQTSSGIADAFSAFGGGFAEYANSKSEATLLRQQNDELRKTLTKQILRPAVGGIYGGGDVPLESFGGIKNPRLPSSMGRTDPLIKNSDLNSSGPKKDQFPNRDDIEMTHLSVLGYPLYPHPRNSDVGKLEERAGDNIATELMGAVMTADNINYSMHKHYASEYKKAGGTYKEGYKPSKKMDRLGLNVGISGLFRDAYNKIGW